MGFFKSEEDKRAEAAHSERVLRILRKAGAASPDALVQALATVYGCGGQLNGTIMTFDHDSGLKAVRHFVGLLGETDE